MAHRKELEKIERDLARAIQAILDGVPGTQLTERIGDIEAREVQLVALLANSEEPAPVLHPNMAEIYRERISALYERLQGDDGRSEAAEVLRTLVERVIPVPDQNGLGIVLRGDLAAILSFAAGKKKPDLLSEAGRPGDLISPGSVVAGIRTRQTWAMLVARSIRH